MNHPPLRFAVIGCGALAQSQHIPNIQRSDRMALELCCDSSDETLAICKNKFGVNRVMKNYEDAVRDPNVDAICLATTERMRLPVIAAAAAAGKPIFVEKPLAPSLEELYRIRDVVVASKIKFRIGHNRRCAPAMVDAHRIFRNHMKNPAPCPWRWDREGAGRPRLAGDGVAGMSVRINDDWYSWKKWAMDTVLSPHGPLLFELTHFTDLCNWFLASDPVEVVAVESGPFNHAIVIRYSGGELATITMSDNGTFGYPKELYEMMGNGAVVAVDHMVEVRTAGIAEAAAKKTYPMRHDRHPQVGTEGGISGWLAKKRAACAEAAAAGDPMLQFTAEPDKGHMHVLERFVDEIRGTGPAVCGIEEAVLATRVAFAAIESVRRKGRVGLSEI